MSLDMYATVSWDVPHPGKFESEPHYSVCIHQASNTSRGPNRYLAYWGLPPLVILLRSRTSSSFSFGRIFSSSIACLTGLFSATAFLAIFAALSYPIAGATAVTSARLFSAYSRHFCRSAVIPLTHFSPNSLDEVESISIDSRRSYAMTGIMMLSSNCPNEPQVVIDVSFPTTFAATNVTASGITGFTLPGMALDPGWAAGISISAMPVRGPEASSRRSFAIFIRLTAIVLKIRSARFDNVLELLRFAVQGLG